MKKLVVGACAAVAAAVSSFGQGKFLATAGGPLTEGGTDKFRWTVDGGANWTYSTSGRLSEIAEGATALAEAEASNDAPAFETTVESAVVEILAPDCTLDKNIYFDKSFTLRSGEGGPFTVTRTGDYRFESSGTGEPTLMMTNVVLDGGVTWKYATIDTNLTAAANCELADGSKAHKGTILELYRKATLILEDGVTVRNVQTFSEYSQAGIGGIVIGHHWDSASGFIEIRHGATLRDIRGPVHVVRCSPTTEGSGFRMTGGLITGCVNSNTNLGEYASAGGLVFLRTPLKSMSGGTVSGNYVYSRGMFFVDYASGASRMMFTGTATVTNNFCEVGGAGICPWYANQVGFSGAVVVKDNFTRDGKPANVYPVSGSSWNVYLVGELDHAASIHVTCEGTKAAGAILGYTDGFTGTPLQPANFVNDLMPGYVGNVSGSEIKWVVGTDPEPGKKYGLRYSTDGGATWTEQELLVLPDCGGILSANNNGGTVESNIIEIFSDVTLNETRTFANSFTIRNAEGYAGRIIREGQYRFDSSESVDAGQTMYVTNLVIDGGITWKHPTLDIANGVAENAAIAAQTGNSNYGTLIRFGKYGKLILDAGAVIQNAQTKYVYYNMIGYGIIACTHHFETCTSCFEMRPGAIIRDCRGDGPVVWVSSSATKAFVCDGAVFTGCMNMSTEKGGTILLGNIDGTFRNTAITNNIAAQGGGFWSDNNTSTVLHVSDTVIANNYVTQDGGAYYAYYDHKPAIAISGSIYFYDNWMVDPVTLNKVRNDVCVASGVWRNGLDAARFLQLEGNLADGSRIGCFYGRHAVDTTGCGIGLTSPSSTDFKSYVAVAQAAAGVDLSKAADIFVNEVMPDYVVKVQDQYVGWEKGPNADDTEDVAEVYTADGTLVAAYRNAVEAVVAARKKTTATVKFLKDVRLPGILFNEGEHITFTSDEPVTVTVACGLTWPNVLFSKTPGSVSFEVGGQVTFRHVVASDGAFVRTLPRADWAGGNLKGDFRLSGQAVYAGGLDLDLADSNFFVGDAATVTGTVKPGDVSRLVLTGPFSGTVPVSAAAKTEGGQFATISADYTTPTAADAHGFRNANDPGLCGMLSNGTLVWMRCAVTIQDDGTVDTYDYAGDLTLGSTYEFTVNASADYLNSKVGRRGKAYPLIRANSVTGKPNLILPAGLDYRWYAREVYDGDTLIGYDLVSNGPGLMLLVR